MMTIMLYGWLGQKFGRVHRREVRNPAEAVRALCATLPGFKKAVRDGGWYRVLVGGSDSLSKEQLHDPMPSSVTLRIVPVIAGAGAVGRIIIGIVLVIASYFGAPTLQLGVSMIIGGVAQLMFAKAPINTSGVEKSGNTPSYAFDGAVNTAAQGNPVSICYGELLVGSQVVSAGLSVEQFGLTGGGAGGSKERIP